MATAEEILAAQRSAWSGLSAGWEKWDALIMAQLGPVGDAMVERLGIAEDQQHLDVASGTGEPGLTIARLAPRGRVTLTDLAGPMLDVAARRAAAQGITNIDTLVCSADDLPFDDESFDSVSVRFGYMFLPDLAAATREFARVLRPGGRLCASVWIRPDDNPWTSIPLAAVSSEVQLPPPDPHGPGMFRCAAPGFVSALYAAAGLRDIQEWDLEVTLVAGSPQEYWDLVSEHVSSAVAALARVDAEARERIAGRAMEAVSAYEVDGRIEVPGAARCIIGTKPTGATDPTS